MARRGQLLLGGSSGGIDGAGRIFAPEVHPPDGAARGKTGTDLKPHFEEPGQHSCLWGGELGVWRSGWERDLSLHTFVPSGYFYFVHPILKWFK